MKTHRMHGPNLELEFAAVVRAHRRRRDNGGQNHPDRTFWLITPTGERRRL